MTSETTSPPSPSGPASDSAAVHMGRHLIRRREALGLSRRWLASLLGVPDRTFRAWEEGTTRIDGKALHDLSVLLDVPMTYFVRGLPSPSRPKRLEALLRTHLVEELMQTALTAPPAELKRSLLRQLAPPLS